MHTNYRISGKKTYAIPFTKNNASSEDYLYWMRDFEVIKNLNIISYIEKNVSTDELVKYFLDMESAKDIEFYSLNTIRDNKFIGSVKISKINNFLGIADLGIMIGDRNYWGKGIATDILEAFCNYIFYEKQLRKITCGLMASNMAMKKVFKKLGFRTEGVFRKVDWFDGEFIDHIYMGCFESEYSSAVGK